MIACPRCGGPTGVRETRVNPSGLRRRRQCRKVACGGKVTTVEVIVHTGDRLPGGLALVPIEKLRRMAADLADALQEQVGTVDE